MAASSKEVLHTQSSKFFSFYDDFDSLKALCNLSFDNCYPKIILMYVWKYFIWFTWTNFFWRCNLSDPIYSLGPMTGYILGHILAHTKGTYYVLYERKGGSDKYSFLILRLRLLTIVFCKIASFGSNVCTPLIFKGSC